MLMPVYMHYPFMPFYELVMFILRVCSPYYVCMDVCVQTYLLVCVHSSLLLFITLNVVYCVNYLFWFTFFYCCFLALAGHFFLNRSHSVALPLSFTHWLTCIVWFLDVVVFIISEFYALLYLFRDLVLVVVLVFVLGCRHSFLPIFFVVLPLPMFLLLSLSP